MFFSGNNSILIKAEILKKNTNQNKSLGVNYLKNIPDFNYIIGPGDELRIIVSRDYPELMSTSVVDGEGTIYLPKLNRVYVENLAINELNATLNEAFEKFVLYPEVEVEIVKYRPIRVFVDGEVERPGLVTLPGSISITDSKSDVVQFDSLKENSNLKNNFFPTVFDAIQKSGGITQFSDMSNIQVIRKANLSRGGGQITTLLNFNDLLTLGDGSQNIRIYDSDIIKIKKTNEPDQFVFRKAVLSNLNPKFISVSVYGRVTNPGKIDVSKSGVLTDAIDIAGGTKLLKGPLSLLRFNNDGTYEKRKFSYRRNAKRGSYKNPYLKDGDFIFVGNSFLSSTSEVISEITSPFIGIYSTYGLIKIIND